MLFIAIGVVGGFALVAATGGSYAPALASDVSLHMPSLSSWPPAFPALDGATPADNVASPAPPAGLDADGYDENDVCQLEKGCD